MLKTILVALLPFLIIFSNGWDRSMTDPNSRGPQENTGTLEKLIVASGSVAMDLNLTRLNGGAPGAKQKTSVLRFDVEPDSFFKVVVFNGEFRAALPSSMALIAQNSAALPTALSASHKQLVIESVGGEEYTLV